MPFPATQPCHSVTGDWKWHLVIYKNHFIFLTYKQILIPTVTFRFKEMSTQVAFGSIGETLKIVDGMYYPGYSTDQLL